MHLFYNLHTTVFALFIIVTYIRRMEFTGELAALTTAFCWAFTSLFFAESGKIIGSFKVNNIRLLMAVIIYMIVLFFTKGSLFPENLTSSHVVWLGLSGFVGLVIGDGAGFKSMVMIGPRLTSLIYSLAPVMATIIAWFFLDEKLELVDMFGISLTLGGIGWVISERQYKYNSLHNTHPDNGSLAKGVLLGVLAALGQATGLVLAKHAMLNLGTELPPMESAFIRMLISMFAIWIIAGFRGQLKETIRAMKNKKAMGYALGGSIAGPFLGVWMSLLAVKYIAAGIAATLNSTTPIWLLPLTRIVQKDKISLRVVTGTVIAVGGIAILMLY